MGFFFFYSIPFHPLFGARINTLSLRIGELFCNRLMVLGTFLIPLFHLSMKSVSLLEKEKDDELGNSLSCSVCVVC